MKYDIWIMNHPDRDIQPTLIEALSEMNYKYNTHNEINDLRNISINIMKRFLANSDKNYILLCQDDVILGKNFFLALNHILENVPNQNMISFYSQRKEFDTMDYDLHPYQNKWLNYTYVIIVNRNFANKMIEHKDDTIKWLRKENTDVDDEYISAIRSLYNLPYLITHPSFVQHDVSVSSTNSRNKGLYSPKNKLSMISRSFDKNIDLFKEVKKFKFLRRLRV